MSIEGVEPGAGETQAGQGGVGPPEATRQMATCPRCGGPTWVGMVRTDFWEGDRLIAVEDIPAHVCDPCGEQFYSEPVTDALRKLGQEGLESAKPKREISVPVYSLEGRTGGPEPLSETCRRCGGLTSGAVVRADIWQGDRLIVVEDIPACVCDSCGEQFYSGLVADALRRLVQEGLKSAKPKKEFSVPVYSLEGRIVEPEPPSEELLGWYAKVLPDLMKGI